MQMFPGHDKRHGTRTGTHTAPGRTGHEPLGPTWLLQPVLAPHSQMVLPSKALPQYILHVRYRDVGMRQMEHGDSSAPGQHPHPLLPCPICSAPQQHHSCSSFFASAPKAAINQDLPWNSCSEATPELRTLVTASSAR